MGEVYPDPKPARRLRDPDAMRAMHSAETKCRICDRTDISAHHLVPRSQGGDDHYPGNLVPLCGTGTTGCHGDVETRSNDARHRLRRNLRVKEINYVVAKKSEVWLDRQYPPYGRQVQQAATRTRQAMSDRIRDRKDPIRNAGRG